MTLQPSPRVLVTGGAGFIGSHVVDALLADGFDLAVLDNLSTGKRENLNPAARFYGVDLRDARAVAQVLDAERPSVVCHQAALCDVRASVSDPAGYAKVNIVGTLNLLQATIAVGYVKRFVFASTGGAVYGEPAELPATESCPARPLDPYGATKLACEQFLFTYRHNFGLETVILRYANVYGPRQDPRGEAGVVAIFAGRMLGDGMSFGRPLTIYGDGLQQRDFVYVADVARANVLAVRSSASGTFNIGTGQPADIVTIFRELAQITGYAQPPEHVPAKPGEARRNYLDASEARRELGWKPQVSLAEGLAQTVAHLQASYPRVLQS